MADDVRMLPTEWVGTAVATTWGVSTKHHPRHDSHGHMEPGWHGYVDPSALWIVRQEGRSLELLVVSGGHEAKAVGTLSADGRRLVYATQEVTAHATIDGDTMEVEAFSRPHGSERSGGTFGAGMATFTAKS